MEIDRREAVQLGASTQWIRIRAVNTRNPLLLLVWFEHSAHMPHLEEPERFRDLLAKIRLGLPATT